MSAEIDKNELPPLPEKEKTYAGIPEAVFVVSIDRIAIFTLTKREV